MPLYAGIGGAQKEIGEIYAGIGGYAKKLEQLYAGVDGAAKELLASGYTWKKYSIGASPTLELVVSDADNVLGVESTRTDSTTYYIYGHASEEELLNNADTTNSRFAFPSSSKIRLSHFNTTGSNNTDTTYAGRYISTYLSGSTYYLTKNTSGNATSSKYVLHFSGRYFYTSTGGTSGTDKITRLYGDVYQYASVEGRGEYIGTVSAEDVSAYPMNGEQNGYWYVYDGEVTWAKYYLNQISEPSEFGSEASFSSSQSWPLLMASQAKKDSNGNVDWGTTYSASSAANLRSNYSTYPYCSFASTLDADNLYMITTASIYSYKRKQVTGWAVTSESAGDYIGDVTGKIGDYPENGIQDGYWYIQQEIT